MASKLLDLPEHLFFQLMKWLTLDEFSLLDCSFCCLKNRDLILKYISSSTIYSPIEFTFDKDERGEMALFWSWLQKRKIYIKTLLIESIKEASLFITIYFNRLTKECVDILGNTMKDFYVDLTGVRNNEMHLFMLECLMMTTKSFHSLESFSCCSCFLSDNILENLFWYTKKLRSISFSYLPNITDVGLSNSLSACKSTIQILSITGCPGISCTNISTNLFSNITELNFAGNNLESICCMSLGLTGLKSLILSGMESGLSDDSIRAVFINLNYLTSIKFYDISGFSGISLENMISPSLTDLTLKSCIDISQGGLCYILSNNLINLRSLAIYDSRSEIGSERLRYPSLRSLISLTLCSLAFLTDDELNDMFSANIPGLKSLDLSRLDMVTGNELKFHLPSSLQKLYISLLNMCDAGLKQLLSNKPANLSGMIIHCRLITGEGLDAILPESLSTVDLYDCGITSKGLFDILSNDLPNLKSINLSCNIVDCEDSFRLSTSNLHSLILQDNVGMTDDGLYHLFLHNNLINLTRLDLKMLTNITNLSLKPSLPQSLVRLDISFMKNLTDLGLNHLLSNNLVNLRSLYANSCETITCIGLTGVLPNNLEYLYLINCKSLTCRGLYDLIFNHSTLTYIDIRDSGVDKKDGNKSIPGIVKFIISITVPNARLICNNNDIDAF
eukprot:gene8184-11072_t